MHMSWRVSRHGRAVCPCASSKCTCVTPNTAHACTVTREQMHVYRVPHTRACPHTNTPKSRHFQLLTILYTQLCLLAVGPARLYTIAATACRVIHCCAWRFHELAPANMLAATVVPKCQKDNGSFCTTSWHIMHKQSSLEAHGRLELHSKKQCGLRAASTPHTQDHVRALHPIIQLFEHTAIKPTVDPGSQGPPGAQSL